MRYARHDSPCTHTALAQPETNRICSPHTDPTLIDRGWPHLDVGPHVEHAPDKHIINAERAAAARRPLHSLEVYLFLDHRTHLRNHTSHSNAKNTVGSKLPVTGHDLWPCEQSRWCAWWLTAHGVSKGSTEAWHDASGRTNTPIGARLDRYVHQTRQFLKPSMTSVASSRPRGASSIKLQTRAQRLTRSKPGLPE